MRQTLRRWLGITKDREEYIALSGAYLELTRQYCETAQRLEFYEQYVESIRFAKERLDRKRGA